MHRNLTSSNQQGKQSTANQYKTAKYILNDIKYIVNCAD